MLTLQCKNNKIDLEKSKKAIEKSILLAAHKVGSMRGVLQGDMQSTLNNCALVNAA